MNDNSKSRGKLVSCCWYDATSVKYKQSNKFFRRPPSSPILDDRLHSGATPYSTGTSSERAMKARCGRWKRCTRGPLSRHKRSDLSSPRRGGAPGAPNYVTIHMYLTILNLHFWAIQALPMNVALSPTARHPNRHDLSVRKGNSGSVRNRAGLTQVRRCSKDKSPGVYSS